MRALHKGDVLVISSRTDILDRFSKIVNENAKYIQLGEHLGNILGTGAEIVQDKYAIHLLRMNNTFSLATTWLGVIGTIFLVPNTIATVMAASAYPLGEKDVVWYSAFLIISTILSSFVTYFALNKFWKDTFDSTKSTKLTLSRFASKGR
jgi:Mg2+ and Co2+ transporter CorA